MFNKDRKTKAIERVFSQKQQKPRVKKFAIVITVLMGFGAAIAQAAKKADQR